MMRRFSQAAFGLLLFLLLASHTPDDGAVFAWLPLPMPTAVAHLNWKIGVFSLLPVFVVGGWLATQYAIRNIRISSHHPLRNSWAITVPLAAFTLLVLLQLTPATAYIAAMIGLCWLIFLFLANNVTWQQEKLWLILTGVLLLQGSVGVAQFLGQGQLGLAWLGEPTLDLLVEGTSVAQRDGQNWLRAYGLNSHPNQLGLLLMTLCLLVWPNRHRAKGWLRGFFWLGLAVGMAGMLVSLSRAAWLGLLVGGAVYGLHFYATGRRLRHELAFPLVVFAIGILLFTMAFGDLLVGRLWALDTPLESRSLTERQRDSGVALALIGQRPFLGVGLGQYLPAAVGLDEEAGIVHNVPLLIGAELGLLGMAIWLLFWGWPLWHYGRSAAYKSATAVWLSLILFACVHPEPTLYLPKGAALWGLVAAQWVAPAAVPAGRAL